MKKNIFLYLFVFAALIAVYSIVNGNKIQSRSTDEIKKVQAQVSFLKDSLEKEQLRILDIQYFSLENNDDALSNYDHLELENLTRYIEDKLLETNESKGDNPLIPYEGMHSDFKINKIKVLNHLYARRNN